MKKTALICLTLVFLLSINTTVSSSYLNDNLFSDFDPLVDVTVTFEVKAIRYLEDDSSRLPINKIPDVFILNILNRKISEYSNPSMFLKVFINDIEFKSNVWVEGRYVYNPDFSVTVNVPDDQEFVDIKIQLWALMENDVLCDISGDFGNSEDGYDVELQYSILTGHWSGDDYLEDPSGYGRLNGCDDGSIYQHDRDSELWFEIYQNDYDEDGIPYWSEINDYGSDPMIKNYGDPDNDDIPLEWEWKWGYDPFSWDDHRDIDPDKDSIDNFEEYLTSDWFSDPFRKDVFVELDIMEDGPNGEKSYFPDNSNELIQTAFDRQNIVFHLDMGEMGGHDLVTFYDKVSRKELNEIYKNFFLHNNENNWRRGVFHYGVVVYSSSSAAGYMFRSNAFQISTTGHEKLSSESWAVREVVYASAYMHELGHTFSFYPIPGHDRGSMYPWQLGWWINRPYKSCMNYGWMYYLVDYSDGSRSSPDIDDWSRIDFDSFERDW
jgi:hypothetical protein